MSLFFICIYKRNVEVSCRKIQILDIQTWHKRKLQRRHISEVKWNPVWALNNVISQWLSKKRSDAICGLHFFPQPNKTIHHFHFRIISSLKLLEGLPVNHFRSSLDNARKGWLDLVSVKLLDSSLVSAQSLCWETWWKCGLRSGGM